MREFIVEMLAALVFASAGSFLALLFMHWFLSA